MSQHWPQMRFISWSSRSSLARDSSCSLSHRFRISSTISMACGPSPARDSASSFAVTLVLRASASRRSGAFSGGRGPRPSRLASPRPAPPLPLSLRHPVFLHVRCSPLARQASLPLPPALLRARLLLRPRTAVRLIPATALRAPASASPRLLCHPRSVLLLPQPPRNVRATSRSGATRRRHGPPVTPLTWIRSPAPGGSEFGRR